MQENQFDVIAVQSAGLRRLDDGTYRTTLYTDRDDFGMLGGFVRVLAAEELFWQKPDLPFVFCNGKSAKQIAKFGPNVPTDAEIHEEQFVQDILRDQRHTLTTPQPTTFLENTSVNTVASIVNLFDMSKEHGWQTMGLISSDYHIPRIQALCELIFAQLQSRPVTLTFLSAERLLKERRPGVYDTEIDTAYATPDALERIKNEQNGCQDIAAGRYHLGEFQLKTS